MCLCEYKEKCVLFPTKDSVVGVAAFLPGPEVLARNTAFYGVFTVPQTVLNGSSIRRRSSIFPQVPYSPSA